MVSRAMRLHLTTRCVRHPHSLGTPVWNIGHFGLFVITIKDIALDPLSTNRRFLPFTCVVTEADH